ncbi:MAG: hypothetical protein NT166_12240 [Candidatus Aminicenantes bacterium]|nr:hypothetical protein [Candidatus Aminicenantes bacterium]
MFFIYVAVLEEVKAAELLMEAGAAEEAAHVILNIDPLLDRWGLGGYWSRCMSGHCPGWKEKQWQ